MMAWIKRLFGQAGRSHDALPNNRQSEMRMNDKQSSETVQPIYFSDQPIHSKKEDRFNRWKFAAQIADTIARRHDPSSIVIGLYGPWGDGKTSTLRLMEKALTEHQHVVVIGFNPWHFQSEEQLLKGFFATLAQALGKSIPTLKEKIGAALKGYGSILSLASISVGSVIQINAGDTAKGLGDALSAVELDDLRSRIENLLAESGKRIVVLIDDIDRLDRVETHAIFKLVKLSASFDHTSYVLSFDDEMVAAAIGERYGDGGYEAGRSFLEKIIQVPLHLPPPDQIQLRQMTFEGVEGALTQVGITLTQEHSDTFAQHFIEGLEERLRTPRHAKLYVNALMFALPILKGEVHPVDLMLIEGLRVAYPKLYIAIRNNPECFLKGGFTEHYEAEMHEKLLAEVLNQSLKGMSDAEKVKIHNLLHTLFPRMRNTSYDSGWDRRWAREQRICSDHYFKRYFAYDVPSGDVADLEVVRFLDSLSGMDEVHQNLTLQEFSNRNAFPHLIRKLREWESEVEPAIARPLALAIARNGSFIPRERGMLISDMTLRQAGILLASLLKRIPMCQEREFLADEICRHVQPLAFGFEYIRQVRHSDKESNHDRLLSVAAEQRICAGLAERIGIYSNETPLYLSSGRDAPRLYFLWNKFGNQEAVTAHLRARFEANPGEVDTFLDTFVGEAWGMEDGLPHRADFDRESYDAIAKLINPEIIVENLRQRYGGELDTPSFHLGRDVSLARRIAHQFVYIHTNLQEQPAKPR